METFKLNRNNVLSNIYQNLFIKLFPNVSDNMPYGAMSFFFFMVLFLSSSLFLRGTTFAYDVPSLEIIIHLKSSITALLCYSYFNSAHMVYHLN